MTFVLPNYFIEECPEMLITADSLFCAAYSGHKNQEHLYVRTTMHMIIAIQEGQKLLQSGEETYRLGKSDLLLLPQGNYFMSEVLSPHGLYRATLFFMEDAFLKHLAIKHGLIDPAGSHPPHLHQAKQTPAIQHIFESIALYHQNAPLHKTPLLHLKTEELLLNLLEQDTEDMKCFLQGALASGERRILSILESNLDVLESAADMAKLCRLPANRLRKEILELTGFSPKQWLLSKKLEQAALLLSTTNQPIQQIATSCSFATPSWFASQFKNQYGITPNGYRLQNR